MYLDLIYFVFASQLLSSCDLPKRSLKSNETNYPSSLSIVTSTAALTEHTLHLLLSKAATASHFSPSISYTNSESPAQLFPPSILPVDIPLALSSLKSLESSLNNSSSHATKIEKESARIILAWGYYSIGEFERCLELLEGQEMKGLGSLETTGGCEGYDLVLRVLGCALLGSWRFINSFAAII